MSIANLEQAKAWLRIESDYTLEDALLQQMLDASEEYIINATGKRFTAECKLAALLQQVLVCEMYEHRDAVGDASKLSTKPLVQSFIVQLQYAVEAGEAE